MFPHAGSVGNGREAGSIAVRGPLALILRQAQHEVGCAAVALWKVVIRRFDRRIHGAACWLSARWSKHSSGGGMDPGSWSGVTVAAWERGCALRPHAELVDA